MTTPTGKVGSTRRVNPSPAVASSHRPALALLMAALLSLITLAPAPLSAQEATGTVTGRVLNRVTGDSMGNARVAIKGTNRATQTDAGGFYTLANVPPGEVTLEASFTGFAPETATVITKNQRTSSLPLSSCQRTPAHAPNMVAAASTRAGVQAI